MRLKGGVCCALQYGRGGGSVRQFESGWPSVCVRARALSVCVRLVVGGGGDARGGLGPYRGELSTVLCPIRTAVCLSTVGGLEEVEYLQPVSEHVANFF